MTAAFTVAAYHAVAWLVIPQGVFNYDATIWTVVVHALFVVIESVAAIFVAHSFFDNTIGLERAVAARTQALDVRNRDMAMILDHVDQGFVTVGPPPTRSARPRGAASASTRCERCVASSAAGS